MTFAKHAGAALLGIALLASPAWADPTETAKAAGKDASWLFIPTAQKVQFDGTTLTFQARVLEGMPPVSGGATSVFIDGGCNVGNPGHC